MCKRNLRGHVSKGLNQAVDREDIVQLDTIEAVDPQQEPKAAGGWQGHMSARAVYFEIEFAHATIGQRDRPSPNERTYENLGPLSDV